MKFLLDDDIDFIDGETEEDLTLVDYRTVSTIKEASVLFWFEHWYANGENHREEKGMIACNKKEKVRKRVIDVKDLDFLMTLQDRFGVLIIENSYYLEVKKRIII